MMYNGSMKEIDAKTLLSKNKYPNYWFGGDYTLNLYKGCSHGCIYCDSRSDCYRIDNFDSVKVKKDALLLLEKELKSKKEKGVIGIGAMSDTYNPFEKELEITRKALKLINKYGYGVALDTKSDLIVRDIDIFKEIASDNNVICKITITCADDELSKKIEPNVCASSKRFEAIKKLSEAGIFTGVLFTPILPFINDDEKNIKGVIRLAHENGAAFVFSMYGVTLRDTQREYFYQCLDELFPNMSYRYRRVFRMKYMCQIDKHKIELFENECRKYGLLYKMEDIIKAYKKEKNKQLTLL